MTLCKYSSTKFDHEGECYVCQLSLPRPMRRDKCPYRAAESEIETLHNLLKIAAREMRELAERFDHFSEYGKIAKGGE